MRALPERLKDVFELRIQPPIFLLYVFHFPIAVPLFCFTDLILLDFGRFLTCPMYTLA
jgi:hypothetical protein